MKYTDTDIYNRILREILLQGIQQEVGSSYFCPPGHNSANNFVSLFPSNNNSSLNSQIESSIQSMENSGLITAYKTTVVGDIMGISYTSEQKGKIEAILNVKR